MQSNSKERGNLDLRSGSYSAVENGQEIASGTFGPNIHKYFDEWKFGQNIPNFHKRRRDGELLPHTKFQHYVGQGEHSWTHHFLVDPGNPNEESWTFENLVPVEQTVKLRGVNAPYFYTLPESLYEHVDIELVQDLVQQTAAKLAAGGHDSLTFLAELHKVKTLFKSKLIELIRLLRRYKPNHLYSRASKAIAGDWLNWRYGWRTLIYDLMDLHETLANFDAERTRYSERTGFTERWDNTWEGSNISSVVDTWTFPRHTSYEVSMRGNVTADIEPPKFQFDLLNTAWELVPGSFILDWFIQIGQYINTLDFLTMSRAHSSSYGFRIETVSSGEYTAVTWKDAGLAPRSGTSSYTYNETATLEVRVPYPVSNLPQLAIKLDAFKILDLLAIARSLIRY